MKIIRKIYLGDSRVLKCFGICQFTVSKSNGRCSSRPAVVANIVIVGVVTCVFLHSMCNLKAAQMNELRNLIQKLQFYGFELSQSSAEATKNICCVKDQIIVHHSTVNRKFKNNNSGFGKMVRVFTNGPGDLGSFPGWVIPKTQKMVLNADFLNTQHYKIWVKWINPGKGVAPSPTPLCSCYWKVILRVTLDCSRQFYFYLQEPRRSGNVRG